MENTTTEIQTVQADSTALYLLTKAEIDSKIATAKAFPRDYQKFLSEAILMATINEEIAESCTYSLPRKKINEQTGQWETVFITGPSVRLAEIACAAYENIQSGSRIISNDGKTIVAQGICHDLQKNNSRTVEVNRRITGKNGKTFNDDMQMVTGNAAGSIAFRNAVFSVIPAAFIDQIEDAAKEKAKGTVAQLDLRVKKAIAYFEGIGITSEMICKTLEVSGIDKINIEKFSILRGFASAIKNEGVNPKDIFSIKEEPGTEIKVDKDAEQDWVMLTDCKTIPEVQELFAANPDMNPELVDKRIAEIEGDKK